MRTCSDSFYANRTRPCLLYQIKRCSAPCTREITLDGYAELVREARDFLSGRSRAIRQRLARDMTEASEALEFETRGAAARPHLRAFGDSGRADRVNPRSVPEADVFAIVEEAGHFCVEAVFFRTYQNWGNRAYFPRADRALSAAEVLDAFLGQFYLDRPAPRLVLLSHAAPSAATFAKSWRRAGHRIGIGVPKRGEKKELVENALRNAREALSRKLWRRPVSRNCSARSAQCSAWTTPPRRVEVYDNSHIMGTNAIGAMIVAGPEGFVKNQYRTFNIKSAALTPGDDYAMMREVLTRRFARLLREAAAPAEEGGFPDRPDLVIIDGGRGQFEAARQVFAELGVEGVKLASIAKGPDRNAGRESVLCRRARAVHACQSVILRCSLCNGCATRRIASRSAPIGRGARRNS